MKRYFAVLALFAAALPIMRAQSIAFTNPSFETPTVPGGGVDFTASSTGWDITGSAGNFDPSVNGVSPSVPPGSGSQWAFIDSGGTMTQAVSDTFLANSTYTFSIDIGSRNPDAATGIIVLGYMFEEDFIPLSSQTLTPDPGTYDLAMGTYSTGVDGVGWPIAIRLVNGGSPQVLFDNLQVSVSASAIPEPSTYAALFGAVVLGFGGYRRIRQRKLAAVAAS